MRLPLRWQPGAKRGGKQMLLCAPSPLSRSRSLAGSLTLTALSQTIVVPWDAPGTTRRSKPGPRAAKRREQRPESSTVSPKTSSKSVMAAAAERGGSSSRSPRPRLPPGRSPPPTSLEALDRVPGHGRRGEKRRERASARERFDECVFLSGERERKSDGSSVSTSTSSPL